MYDYEKKPGKIKRTILLILLMMIVSASSILLYSMYINIDIWPQMGGTHPGTRVTQREMLGEEEYVTDMLEEAIKAVVGISQIQNMGMSIFSNESERLLGLGTGIIVSENGYILTNWHVAGNRHSTCYVTLEDGRTYTGRVVWADADLDVAVVKIDANGLPYFGLADSDKIRLGKPVYAIGNPIGIEFKRTVTSGIISGLNRTIRIEEDGQIFYMDNLIQTDATINPGNSGGPLINQQGEVIGINTVKITTAEGIGFAIPINMIKPVVEQFIATGTFEEAYLGIFGVDKAAIPFLDSNIQFDEGIYVMQVAVDGPASRAGIRVRDIILEVDGLRVDRMSELRRYIYTRNPNDTIRVIVLRNNREHNFNVVLGSR
ncbi:MAG: trypsin-like peptidase domain-containing protein [Oscillospiraceae bacterium]|nr:trypsin-like peptidase domain-containing protein [Oscillospiraceae bacterium]